MAYQKRRTTNYQLYGGINQKSSKYTVQENQVDDLRNMDFNIPNALSKRPGYTQMVTAGTTGAITNLFEFERLNGASYLVASSDTALFYLNSGAYTDIVSGFSSGQAFDMLAFIDKMWACNGETFIYWTGETTYPHQGPEGYIGGGNSDRDWETISVYAPEFK